MRLHLRADVPVGAYVSGGIDSSIVARARARSQARTASGVHRPLRRRPGLRREPLRRDARERRRRSTCTRSTITPGRLRRRTSRDVIYHLDFPVAGPGSFPQYMRLRARGEARKVVLGGQGGDEIFGGYARYLLAYFEQCIKAAIEGTMHDGNFVVTYESIIPNLARCASTSR